MKASECGHAKVVGLLVAAGADVHAVDKVGECVCMLTRT